MKTPNEIKAMICREYGITPDEFDSPFKYGNLPQARQLYCLVLHDLRYSTADISRITGFSPPRVSMTIDAGRRLCDKIPFFRIRREKTAKYFQ
jgi:hypothetical protein